MPRISFRGGEVGACYFLEDAYHVFDEGSVITILINAEEYLITPSIYDLCVHS